MPRIFGVNPEEETFDLPGPDFSNLFGNQDLRVRLPPIRRRRNFQDKERSGVQYLMGPVAGPGPRNIPQSPIGELKQRNRMDVVYDPSLELANREMKLKERQLEGQEKLANRKLELENFIARNPDWEFQVGDDGYIHAINPQDPSKRLKTDIRSNELTDREKLAMQIGGRIEERRIAGEEARRTASEKLEGTKEIERMRQSGRIKTEEIRGEERRKTEGAKSPNELENKREEARRARRFISENPELSEFITIDGDNVIINEELTDPIERQRLSRVIFGDKGQDIQLSPEGADAELMTQAEQILRNAGKKVTPETIDYVVNQLRGRNAAAD